MTTTQRLTTCYAYLLAMIFARDWNMQNDCFRIAQMGLQRLEHTGQGSRLQAQGGWIDPGY